ncbi:MAG TPA: glutaredoxin family protein [Smithella sp.]|nr:glutaredoxin family protein [Smithella sp.]
MKKYLLLFGLLSVFLSQTAMADLYKWVDEKGEVQITDYPPPESKNVKNVQVYKAPPENPANSQNDTDQTLSKDKAEKGKEVILYTKNDCRDCDRAREFLKSKNIPFTEYNMDTDVNAAAQRKKIDDSQDVPFAIIDKSQVFGFSETVYNKALKLNP